MRPLDIFDEVSSVCEYESEDLNFLTRQSEYGKMAMK